MVLRTNKSSERLHSLDRPAALCLFSLQFAVDLSEHIFFCFLQRALLFLKLGCIQIKLASEPGG